MFTEELKKKLEDIFGMRKVTYDAPSDEFEQNTIFIEIYSSQVRLMDTTQTAIVRGSITCFIQNEAMPFGFFNKKIKRASAESIKGLLFHDIDVEVSNSQARTMNLHERRCGFVFCYSGQYDPNKGKMTQLDFGDLEI